MVSDMFQVAKLVDVVEFVVDDMIGLAEGILLYFNDLIALAG